MSDSLPDLMWVTNICTHPWYSNSLNIVTLKTYDFEVFHNLTANNSVYASRIDHPYTRLVSDAESAFVVMRPEFTIEIYATDEEAQYFWKRMVICNVG